MERRNKGIFAANETAEALVLAAIGLYGVTAYAIARRRTEIAIRIALGASAAHIVRLTMSRLAALIALGATIGALVSLWTSRYVASLLYGVQPRDPANLVGGVAVLILTAVVAGLTPVRAALRTDPASSVRCN